MAVNQPLYNTVFQKRVSTNSWQQLHQISTNFQNLLTTAKRRKFPIKPTYYFPPHLKYVAAQPLGILKFKFVAKLPYKIKTHHICKKMKVSFVIWLNGYYYYHNSCPMFACTHAKRHPRHSSIALSVTLWSIPCQMCSKRCYHFMICNCLNTYH